MALQVPKAGALVGKRIRLSASPMLIESAVIAALGDDAYRDFSDLPDQVDPDEELARRQ